MFPQGCISFNCRLSHIFITHNVKSRSNRMMVNSFECLRFHCDFLIIKICCYFYCLIWQSPRSSFSVFTYVLYKPFFFLHLFFKKVRSKRTILHRKSKKIIDFAFYYMERKGRFSYPLNFLQVFVLLVSNIILNFVVFEVSYIYFHLLLFIFTFIYNFNFYKCTSRK